MLLAIGDVQECGCGFLLEEGECMGLKHRDLYKRDAGKLEPPHLTGHTFQESDQEVIKKKKSLLKVNYSNGK